MTGDVFVQPLGTGEGLATVGGKGASLAQLARAGLPVPAGFHITTRAYREFITAGGLAEEIAKALEDSDSVNLATAEAVISAAFMRREIPPNVAAVIRTAYRGLSGVPVAVRSSATAEDLPDMSFAGQHDSYLNVATEQDVLESVKRCWASLWTARAIGYRIYNNVDTDDLALAVVVQQMVHADAAGVMFTANALTGARDELMVDVAWGLGEALVSGEVTPDSYVIAHGSHDIKHKSLNANVTALDPALLGELAGLGERIQQLYGRPMDIEWAVESGRFAILQARPITTLPESFEEWNDTRLGDYLWTSGNVSEAVPSVMTPMTWSVIQALAMPPIAGHPTSGNIGGRFYLNLSATMAIGSAFGMGKAVRQASEQTFGRIPDEVEVPRLPMSRLALIRAAIPTALLFVRQGRAYRKNLSTLLTSTPVQCQALHDRVAAISSQQELLELWQSDVDHLLRVTCQTLDAGARQVGAAKLRQQLGKLVGEADTNTLLTGLHGDGHELASLGPVTGLARLRRGEITRDEYVRAWGHRCPEEFELSAPRPAEDPAWIDRQLEVLADPEDLLRRQGKARAATWERVRQGLGRKAGRIGRQLERAASAARARERARSEMVRTFWVLRAFVLRASELTGHDLFFLQLDEMLAVLGGDSAPLEHIPARQAAYAHYRSLPPYPGLIRGLFDPEAAPSSAPSGDAITGFPGVPGVVEGVARVVSTVEEGEALRPGEILVTTVTNVGWTPLFPRAAAVVTDVGAPLSHAAIVARELGIPAVVGCGNATTRLSTGDRIRVDGGQGTVTLLD